VLPPPYAQLVVPSPNERVVELHPIVEARQYDEPTGEITHLLRPLLS